MEFVPPYGSEGALYVRPLLFGTGARIGLQPSDEYTLLVMVVPVGNYYKGGMKPTTAVVVEDFDRAAPKGVGAVKVCRSPCFFVYCVFVFFCVCLLYTSPSPRDLSTSRMPSSA